MPISPSPPSQGSSRRSAARPATSRSICAGSIATSFPLAGFRSPLVWGPIAGRRSPLSPQDKQPPKSASSLLGDGWGNDVGWADEVSSMWFHDCRCLQLSQATTPRLPLGCRSSGTRARTEEGTGRGMGGGAWPGACRQTALRRLFVHTASGHGVCLPYGTRAVQHCPNSGTSLASCHPGKQ